jgi:hypothetical protein
MASSTPNTILLKRNGKDSDPEVLEIVVHTAAVTPGDLLLKNGSGVTPNTNAADADAQVLFAIEQPYIDPRVTTSKAIDTDYAIAAVARCIYPNRGDLLYAWLETGANVADGAALEASNVAGCLQAYTNGRIIAFADEAKDNSGGAGPVRIKARIA